MFDSIRDLSSKLPGTGYFIDPVMTQVVFLAVVFLAAKLQKPSCWRDPQDPARRNSLPAAF
jgi:hypothetical protein